ncbi:hypothetical protein FACS189431_4530 [Alphaproteobacteria bacterium]|nr:hypothetical protein FACS189431_4530 [Alphaproteobacteria bacterium]
MRKYLGLIGAVVFFTTILIISVALWRDASLTISQHVALTDWSSVLFGVAIIITVGCIGFCLLKIVREKWQFDKIYMILASVIIIGLLTQGLFPYSTGWSAFVHQVFGWTMLGASYLLVIFVMATTWRVSDLALKAAGFAILGCGATAFVLRTLSSNIYYDQAFWWELSYIVLLFCFVLTLTHTSPNSKAHGTIEE